MPKVYIQEQVPKRFNIDSIIQISTKINWQPGFNGSDITVEPEQSEIFNRLTAEIADGEFTTFVPLMPSDQTISFQGTRSLRLRDIKSGKIVCISGLWLVKGRSDYTETQILSSILLEEPEFETIVPLERSGGHTIVTENGEAFNTRSDSPIGTYSLLSLYNKVQNTQHYSDTRLEIVAYGTHQGHDAGWLIYTLPEDTQTARSVYRNDKEQYVEFLRALGVCLGELHAGRNVPNSVAHMEAHAGNVFLTAGTILLSDWSTPLNLEALPSSLNSQTATPAENIQLLQKLSDSQSKAKALDIYFALLSLVRDVPTLEDTEYYAKLTVNFMLGYLTLGHSSLDPEDVQLCSDVVYSTALETRNFSCGMECSQWHT